MFISLLAVLTTASPGGLPPMLLPHHVVHQQVMALTDGDILGWIEQVNTAEIGAARRALTKTSSKAVKEYAQMIIDDHQASTDKVHGLTSKLMITVTMNPDTDFAKAHADEMVDLNGKTGSDFDREYLDAMANAHDNAIDKIKGTLIPAAANSEVKAFLQSMLPTLQQHEDRAKALMSAIS